MAARTGNSGLVGKGLEVGAVFALLLFVGHRECRGIESRITQRESEHRRIVGVHGMQRAAQQLRNPFSECDDCRIELRRLGVLVRRIDGGENGGPQIAASVLEQQYRHGTRAQQLPVGEVHEPGLESAALVAFRDDEIRAVAPGTSHDRLVRWIVPLHLAGGVDAAGIRACDM